MKMKTKQHNIYGMQEKQFLRENCFSSLPQKTRKISNKQRKLPSKRIRKKNQQTKPKSQQKERDNKDQVGNERDFQNNRGKKKSMKPIASSLKG